MKKALEIEALMQAARDRVLLEAPEHIRELGPIIRRSIENDMGELEVFLQKHEIEYESQRLEELRDALIVQRIDLKDLEPAARERLRSRTLATEDPNVTTKDYAAAVASGSVPRCCDCRWFVTAPRDGTPDGDKPCVNFGTKGVDIACRGFTRSVPN